MCVNSDMQGTNIGNAFDFILLDWPPKWKTH
jgi:hypothetical protein